MGDVASAERREQKLRDQWEQAVREAGDVSGLTLLVALTLATYGDRDGQHARPGLATLAHATGLGESTVRRHLERLRRLGWLVQHERGHRRGDGTAVASAHRLTIPAQSVNRSGASAREGLYRSLGWSQPLAGGISTARSCEHPPGRPGRPGGGAPAPIPDAVHASPGRTERR